MEYNFPNKSKRYVDITKTNTPSRKGFIPNKRNTSTLEYNLGVNDDKIKSREIIKNN